MAKIQTPGGSEAGHQIDVTKTTPLVCKCGNHTFTQVSFLRVLSALLSPNSKEAVIPMMTFACNACGAVPDQAIPPFIRDETLAKTGVQSTTESRPGLHLV